ncbi:ATP-dependent helicase [Patescibacteria group bacterium]|nr:MAG: ATP-dependent helicase [Patescibacteria group bacterium]
MIDFSSDLNDEQLNVVLNGDGPCLVLAGAGSGKTRAIVYRAAYLLEQGVKPENILLVTFTNKAAGEMKERVRGLTGNEGLPWAGTFHSIGNRILRHHAMALGYMSNFTILDSDDSESLIKICAKDSHPPSIPPSGRGGGWTGGKFPSAGNLQAIISFSRNAEMALAEVLETRWPQYEMWADPLAEIAKEYEKRKLQANAMDFDDLLVNFSRLLNDPKILKKYSGQFQYILVDEYQDTNKIQASIVKKLATEHGNILVVGDDAQSIYSFRAADIENILRFEKDFPKAKIFKLETNYRSSQEILDVANNVIANNPKQIKKELHTPPQPSPYKGEGDSVSSPFIRGRLGGGVKPELHPKIDQSDEANFVAEKIASLIRGGVEPTELAVLFRAAHHSQQLELELMRIGIDYDYRGGLRFFERSHVKDALAYLRILNNLADTTAWLRVLLFEDGIGPVAAGKIVDYIRKVENVEEVAKAGEVLGDKAQTGWNNFLQIWNSLLNVGPGSPAQLVEAILASPYRDRLEDDFGNGNQRAEDLKQLAIFARKYEKLDDFLSEAALQEAFSMQRKKESASKAHEGKIVLSTIHQAKGLEWSGVFVINLLDGQFPNERALRENGGLEEERRLFYVAVTRAKKYLYLSYPLAGPARGGQSGGWGDSASAPSSFLGEISPDLLEDSSLLLKPSSVFDFSSLAKGRDSEGSITYVDDPDAETRPHTKDFGVGARPFRFKPGSFLRDVGDL